MDREHHLEPAAQRVVMRKQPLDLAGDFHPESPADALNARGGETERGILPESDRILRRRDRKTDAGQFAVPGLLGMRSRFFVLTTYMYRLLNSYPSQYNLAAALGLVMLAVSAFAGPHATTSERRPCAWSNS